ncbi:MAG: GNAT family N-acetyltransferase [Actinomycetota bacterium]
MTVRSLGYRTDLFFIGFEGEVIDRGSYLVARSPANPTHYWGNFLLFDHVPDADELPEWRAQFHAEFGRDPEVRHITLGVDAAEAALAAITESPDPELELSCAVVLTAQQPCAPPQRDPGVEVRALTQVWEWVQAVENQIECREAVHEATAYRVFKERQMARYRRMTAAGLGQWFGAFLGDRLVGDLGLFGRDGFARFQAVGVHPAYRRRGICRALLAHASRYGFEHLGARDLVIVAERDYHALGLYESEGFVARESQVGLCRWPLERR